MSIGILISGGTQLSKNETHQMLFASLQSIARFSEIGVCHFFCSKSSKCWWSHSELLCSTDSRRVFLVRNLLPSSSFFSSSINLNRRVQQPSHRHRHFQPPFRHPYQYPFSSSFFSSYQDQEELRRIL